MFCKLIFHREAIEAKRMLIFKTFADNIRHEFSSQF